ncbi:MAG: LysR substrate-binding domain-containing protein [Pseudomonadota bacterium]
MNGDHMDLNNAFYFVHVVEKQGFSAAARALGIPKSRVSRHVQQLELNLGVRLLQRSSRMVAVTDIGREYYRNARLALDRMEEAEASARRRSSVLEGQVTVSCSVGMAQFGLSRILTRFLTENPRVNVRQQASNQLIDLLENGVDVAIRGHVDNLPDSSLIQRRLSQVPWHLFAAPEFLERTGYPEQPEELERRAGLALGWLPGGGCWSLQNTGGVTASVPFDIRLHSDDMVTLKVAAAESLGIVALPAYVCRDDVAAGRLVRVLSDWTAGEPQISLLMPSKQGVLPPVEAFVDFLLKELPPAIKF